MEKLTVSGFKCFRNTDILLNNLTVLVGANGYGKSSTLQALLLFKQAVDKKTQVNLNGDYGLELGEVVDVINQNYSDPHIAFTLSDENGKKKAECLFGIEDKDEELTLDCVFPTEVTEEKLTQKEFYYISAERQGPRTSQPLTSMDFLSVGTQGEYTAQVIASKGGMTKVETERIYPDTKNPNLNAQVNEWLSYIFPGVTVSANIDNSLLRASVKTSNTYSKSSVHAPNMGFGISYVLPILVNGLVAKKGSYYIIENPEAHLHPAAQTAVGYFLATIAHAGVHVIIETHSDHLIDGIQLFVVRNKEWHKYVTINNYAVNAETEEPQITPITLDDNGDYSEWPDGFMDQTQKNYIERSKA